MPILGAIYAGGRSRRFGADKALAELDGIRLIDRAIAAIAPYVDRVVVCGRPYPGLLSLDDRPAAGLGPLGALAAALHHAEGNGFDAVLTIACDMPALPPALAAALTAGGPRVVDGQPMLGCWPAALAPRLDAYLAAGGDRSLRGWADTAAARRVPAEDVDLPNVNTPEDLASLAARWSARRPVPFRRIAADGSGGMCERAVAVEMPVAIEFNGIGYAVLMATPVDLDDLAVGFALADRVADTIRDIDDVDVHRTAAGMVVRVTLAERCAARVVARTRHRTSESGCGLCGVENLEQAIRPLPRVTGTTAADDAAIFRALAALRGAQPLNAATGAVHAAAACAADGTPLLVREDVGRHNAFDKLIGAMARAGQGWGGGFALLTSRCSFELVEKAALADCPLLVTVSLPTTLAVERARAAGLALRVLARADAILALP